MFDNMNFRVSKHSRFYSTRSVFIYPDSPVINLFKIRTKEEYLKTWKKFQHLWFSSTEIRLLEGFSSLPYFFFSVFVFQNEKIRVFLRLFAKNYESFDRNFLCACLSTWTLESLTLPFYLNPLSVHLSRFSVIDLFQTRTK